MSTGYWILIFFSLASAVALSFWWSCRKISILEAAAGMGASMLVVVLVLCIGHYAAHTDTEIRSGAILKAWHQPWWQDEVLVTETTTDSKGHSHTSSHWENNNHPDRFWAETTLGEIELDEGGFRQFELTHGSRPVPGERPDFHKGDRNDYVSTWPEGADFPRYPMHKTFRWTNNLRNTDSILHLPPVSDKEAAKEGLLGYPEVRDPQRSQRLYNTQVNLLAWDRLNAQVGPMKHVNLTLINFGAGADMRKAYRQEAYWGGGKKNDLVICISAAPGKSADWCRVFGWSKDPTVKQNLESIFLAHPADDNVLPLVKEEVIRNFQPHDWHQYDTLDMPISTGTLVWALILGLAANVGTQIAMTKNSRNQDTDEAWLGRTMEKLKAKFKR